MRDYLFRGKRKDNGEWVYGSLIHIDNFCCILNPDDEGPDYPYMDPELGTIDGYVTPVDPETVGQFTGVCDKNGKRIFEGDIVALTKDVKRTFGIEDGEVKFNHGAFFVNGHHGLRDSLFCIVDIRYILRGEIIGNRWDDPDLVKGA